MATDEVKVDEAVTTEAKPQVTEVKETTTKPESITPVKKSKVPLILGISCGVILLCGILILVVMFVLPLLGLGKLNSQIRGKIDEVKESVDENKDEESDDDEKDSEEDDKTGNNIFYDGQKDPRILVMTYNGWIIVKEDGEIDKEVLHPEIAQAEYGGENFSFYSGRWMPNYSDVLVVRDGAWDEDHDWYISVVDEDGEEMKDIYGLDGQEIPIDPTFKGDGNISFLIGSTIEDPDAWGGVANGGKIVVIDLEGNLVKEYNHTNRLFSGKSGFYWVDDEKGVTVGSYPIEGHAAWYDGVVLADPELTDENTSVLISTYTDYGEPSLLTMSKNKKKLGIIATDNTNYYLNVFTFDMDSNSLQQLTNFDSTSGIFLGQVGIAYDGNTIFYVESNITDYKYTFNAIGTDGSLKWKIEDIEMPRSIDN